MARPRVVEVPQFYSIHFFILFFAYNNWLTLFIYIKTFKLFVCSSHFGDDGDDDADGGGGVVRSSQSVR